MAAAKQPDVLRLIMLSRRAHMLADHEEKSSLLEICKGVCTSCNVVDGVGTPDVESGNMASAGGASGCWCWDSCIAHDQRILLYRGAGQTLHHSSLPWNFHTLHSSTTLYIRR